MFNWITIFIAIASLTVSIVSLIKSWKIGNLDYRIKQLELEELENKKNNFQPCVEARLVHISKGNNHIRVWNSGNATAYNVNVEIDDKNIPIIQPVTPFEFLEPGKSFDETVVLTFSSENKFKIITKWADKSGNADKKEQICTL